MTKAKVQKAKNAVMKLVRAGLLVKTRTGKFELPKLPPKMSSYEAVFNPHVNAAGARAKQRFIDKFGYAVWQEQLEDAYVNGIMAIFKKPPTKWTEFYVATVTKFVNENRY